MKEPLGLAIKEWPEGERPRERCLSGGPAGLSNAELLAILFRTGTRGRTALDLARETLSVAGSLRALATMPPREASGLAGMGPVRAATLAAALELSRRFTEEEVRLVESLCGAEEAYRFLKPR